MQDVGINLAERAVGLLDVVEAGETLISGTADRSEVEPGCALKTFNQLLGRDLVVRSLAGGSENGWRSGRDPLGLSRQAKG